jgi:hypothetical protein
MTRSESEIYTETGKKELPATLTQRHADKKNNGEIKICKHALPDGWCNKKHQRCPLLNLQFINQ